MRTYVIRRFLTAAFALLAAQSLFGDDSDRLLRIDHYIRVRSAVPAIPDSAGSDAGAPAPAFSVGNLTD